MVDGSPRFRCRGVDKGEVAGDIYAVWTARDARPPFATAEIERPTPAPLPDGAVGILPKNNVNGVRPQNAVNKCTLTIHQNPLEQLDR